MTEMTTTTTAPATAFTVLDIDGRTLATGGDVDEPAALARALRETARVVLTDPGRAEPVRVQLAGHEVLIHTPARTPAGQVDRLRLLDELAEAYQATTLPRVREMIDPTPPEER